MSHVNRPAQPLEVRERAVCMCEIGGSCTSYEPGHAVHLIQARLASATPSAWLDAIVEHVDAETGTVTVRDLLDSTPRALWSAGGATAVFAPGDPVALHTRYHVLALGARWFNVRAEH